MNDHRSRPVTVVALGGNALLQRGQSPTWERQLQSAHTAAHRLAALARDQQLVITHGNGPQVGVLSALQFASETPHPLDALDAETAGMIGSLLALALRSELPGIEVVTVVTHTVIDPHDPAFQTPSKPIGVMLTEAQAKELQSRTGSAVRRDGELWRRVVASPEPQDLLELSIIQRLVEAGVVTICLGGGGVPVTLDSTGHQRGIEAVVDKDLGSALLAVRLNADSLKVLTDVDGVMRDWGTPAASLIERLTVNEARALDLPAGSMGTKVEACCRFAEATGRRALISSLHAVDGIGTWIEP